MSEFRYETDLVPKVIAWGTGKQFYAEVPLFKKMMDLYATESNRKTTYAFELKLNDWRRGIVQATYYLLAAEYVYLAVPRRVANHAAEQAKDELEELGLGLLSVDGTVNEIVTPRRSENVMLRCKNDVLRILEDRERDAGVADVI